MNVVVTGGGTVAPIDDVRKIANVSTGRFSATITEACLELGARVRHIHAPSAELPLIRRAKVDLAADPIAEDARIDRLREIWEAQHQRLQLVPLIQGTVAEYSATLEATLREHPIDIAFLAMAVSDYEPDAVDGKIASDSSSLQIRCRRTPKVIRSVRDWSPNIFLVGFKLLSRADPESLRREAEHVCLLNRADLTVANNLQTVQSGRHVIELVQPGRAVETLGPGPDLPLLLVQRVFERFEEREA